MCVCLYVCPAHLWGRSGCSRTLEWHTAPSSAALSCHQQNAQSEPATYCKAQKRMCAIRVMCTVPTYVRTCVTCTVCTHHTLYVHVYIHANTHSIHTCTCTPTHPDMFLQTPTNAHAHTCIHAHTHTFLSSNRPFSLSLMACNEARESLPLNRVDSLVTCSRMLWYGEQQQVRLS